MDYLNGLSKWTTPENHLEGEKQPFEARQIIFLTIHFASASETFRRIWSTDAVISKWHPKYGAKLTDRIYGTFPKQMREVW